MTTGTRPDPAKHAAALLEQEGECAQAIADRNADSEALPASQRAYWAKVAAALRELQETGTCR